MNNEINRFNHIQEDNPPSLFEITNLKYEAGRHYVQAAALYSRLDRGSDAKLKKIMETIRTTEDAPTSRGWGQEALINRAKATDEWQDYLNIVADAHELMLDAYNEKATWESAFECVRSHMSMRKEMIKYDLGGE